MNFVVAAVFKNEEHILKEWIEHYLKWGVEHFYLVNDFSTDNYIEVIKNYSDKITLFHNDIVTKECGRQPKIYERYFKNIPSKWVAIVDLDEFIWSPKFKNIKDCLDDSVSQIKIDWLHFGSSGYIDQPNSVINFFTKRAKFDNSKEYYSFKSIYQTKDLVGFNVHGHIVKGKTIHLKYSDQNPPILIINHYPLQSYNFFMTIKATRGDINNWFDSTGRKRNEKYFKNQDINEIEDTRLMKLNFN
jgi:hypothetical protein